MFVDYKIITSERSTTLEVDVRQALHEGWELYGDMLVLYAGSRLYFYQPMVRTGELRAIEKGLVDSADDL